MLEGQSTEMYRSLRVESIEQKLYWSGKIEIEIYYFINEIIRVSR